MNKFRYFNSEIITYLVCIVYLYIGYVHFSKALAVKSSYSLTSLLIIKVRTHLNIYCNIVYNIFGDEIFNLHWLHSVLLFNPSYSNNFLTTICVLTVYFPIEIILCMNCSLLTNVIWMDVDRIKNLESKALSPSN